MKRYLPLFLLIVGWTLSYTPSVFACSWGEPPPTTLDDIAGHNVVLRGVIFENSRGNSLIHVERYLKGNGAEYILVVENSPDFYQQSVIRGYDFGCGGAGGSIAGEGEHAYFSLNQSREGFYYASAIFRNTNYIPILEGDEGQYILYDEAVETDGIVEYEQRSLSTNEFEAQIAEITGETGNFILDPAQPRFRALYVTTESGQQYLLPVDRNELIPLENPRQSCVEDCVIRSPDGSHFAHPIPVAEDTYAIWYSRSGGGENWYEGWESGDHFIVPPRITAQELLFSPDGDYLLAWQDDELIIYAFNVWENYDYFGRLPTIAPVWRTSLSTNDLSTSEDIVGIAAWSANSNVIAYLDAEGLKWLDLMTMVQPRLLLEYDPTEALFSNATSDSDAEIPYILELSTRGRYVRYGTVQEWSLFDTVTNLVFDDVLVSPDETELIQVSPETFIGNTIRESETDSGTNCLVRNEANDSCYIIDYCHVPMGMCADYAGVPEGYQLVDTHWQSNDNLTILACEIENPDICIVYNGFVNSIYLNEIEGHRTNTYLFDDYYGYLAWATDDYQIRIWSSPFSNAIDFTDVLDSPIVRLEWGSRLWYLED